MRLSKFCEENLISFELKARNKEEVIRELTELASHSTLVKDKEELFKAVMEREKLVTTGVGYGVAFPHAKTKAIKGIVIAFGRSKQGVQFEAMDKKPVHLFFLIAREAQVGRVSHIEDIRRGFGQPLCLSLLTASHQ